MNKFNLKVGQVLGDYRVVSVGEEGAYFCDKTGYRIPIEWFTNDEIQTKFNLPKERWLPKKGEVYWHLDGMFDVDSQTYENDTVDEELISKNNIFRSESEALSKAEEIKKVLMK